VLQDDYLQRLIRQIGQLTARLLGKRRDVPAEVWSTHDGDPPLPPISPDSLEQVEDAYGDLFGLPRGLVDVLDATAVAALLPRPEAAIGLADLVDTDAEVSSRLGLADRARRRSALAAAIRRGTST
jgi:hypothetical protein